MIASAQTFCRNMVRWSFWWAWASSGSARVVLFDAKWYPKTQQLACSVPRASHSSIEPAATCKFLQLTFHFLAVLYRGWRNFLLSSLVKPHPASSVKLPWQLCRDFSRMSADRGEQVVALECVISWGFLAATVLSFAPMTVVVVL